jgi:hypothetical protein
MNTKMPENHATGFGQEDTAMSDHPPDDKAKQDHEAAKKRNQEALQRVLEQKRQQSQQAHQHGPGKPNFSPKFSPKPIRRGPRGG